MDRNEETSHNETDTGQVEQARTIDAPDASALTQQVEGALAPDSVKPPKRFFSKPVIVGAGALIAVLAVLAYTILNPGGNGPAVTPPDVPPDDVDDPTNIPVNLPNIEASLGFEAQIFSGEFTDPRGVSVDSRGNLLVVDRASSTVVGFVYNDGDYESDSKIIISNLENPTEIVTVCETEARCWLYVVEDKQLVRYIYDASRLLARSRDVMAQLSFGEESTQHSLALVQIDREDMLLIGSNAECEVCRVNDPRLATVLRSSVSRGGLDIFASGLKKPAGIVQDKQSGVIWVSDTARRDIFSKRPDELNVLQRDGFYGWPQCYGDNVLDIEYDTNKYIQNPCEEPFQIPATFSYPNLTTPTTFAYVPVEFRKYYGGELLVLTDGGVSDKTAINPGVHIMKVANDSLSIKATHDFMTGWQSGSAGLSKPMNAVIGRNGTLFVTDSSGALLAVTHPVIKSLHLESFDNASDYETPVFDGDCRSTGCGGRICGEIDVSESDCLMLPQYQCYESAICERQAGGECGWTRTTGYMKCVDAYRE